jgi:signal transduction histidine kinase/ActR/RegA family two-component response regulator
MHESVLTASAPTACLVCDDRSHRAVQCPTPAGLLHRLANASVALQVAQGTHALLRTATLVLQELTGARRVEADLFRPDAPSAAADDPHLDDHGGAAPAPLCLTLRSRQGERLGEVRLHPAGEPLPPEVVALAVAVANGVSLLLENMALVEALQEQLRRQDRLLGAVAHAVRQPLTPIVHAAALLAPAAQGDAQVHRARTVIEQEGGRVTQLLDDLLALRELDEERFPLHVVSCDLDALLDEACEAVRPTAADLGVGLQRHGPPGTITLRADPPRLVRVLTILLHNALRFSHRGGVVAVQVACSDTRVRVAVRDDGVGIPPADLEAVFTPRAEIAAHAGRAGQGLGISLALARRLVVRQGGTLTAHSEGIGHGSSFVVRFPATRAATLLVPGGRVAPRPDAAVRRGLRILVVDDNVDAADALALLLTRDGHHVTVCYDGECAVRRQLDDPHDVVLLDIGLPGASGHDVARTIRAAEGDTPALLVALTGWGQPPDRRRSFEAGCDHHLVKPVAFPALRALLRHWRQEREVGAEEAGGGAAR